MADLLTSSTRPAREPSAAQGRGAGVPGSQPAPGRTSLGLLAMLGTSALGTYALVSVFLHTHRGAAWDQQLMGILGGPPAAFERLRHFVWTITPFSVATVLVVMTLVALARRRVAIAAATVFLVGSATATTQVVKYDVLSRIVGTNSFPSGHTTAAMLWALGAVLVVPRRVRLMVAYLGAVFAATLGAGTIAARWHRPSDVVGAALVCLAWSALAVGLTRLTQRRRVLRGSARPPGRYVRTGVLAALTSAALFAADGFVLNGHGVDKIGAGVVLMSVVSACVGTVMWVAAVTDRAVA